LYLGILLNRRQPSHTVRFIDCGDIVGPLPATLVCNPVKPRFLLADAEPLALFNRGLVAFDTVVVKANGSEFQTRGLKFASIDPAVLVQGLKRLALGLGCEFVREDAPPDPDALTDCDVLVVADGPLSRTRDRCGGFATGLSRSKTRFASFALEGSRD